MDTKIISRTPVLHRANVRGLVIVERQLIEIDGQRFECALWANWENPGQIMRVDSHPAAA
jgi:hypothetical protein